MARVGQTHQKFALHASADAVCDALYQALRERCSDLHNDNDRLRLQVADSLAPAPRPHTPAHLIADARPQITACKHQFDMEILQVVCFLHVYSSVADFDTPQCMSLQSRCDELTVELERCQVSRQSSMPSRRLSACRCP